MIQQSLPVLRAGTAGGNAKVFDKVSGVVDGDVVLPPHATISAAAASPRQSLFASS